MHERKQGFGTFSIVGADPRTGEVGVAVASKFLAVGDRNLVRIAVGDPDFAPLRDNPEFQDLLKQYQ